MSRKQVSSLPPREQIVLALLRRNKQTATLKWLSSSTGYPEASVSCAIRTLRKPHYGGHRITKKLCGSRTTPRGHIFSYHLSK